MIYPIMYPVIIIYIYTYIDYICHVYIHYIIYIYPLLYPVYIHCISLAMFIHHETSWNLGVLELWISRWSLEGRWLRHRLSSGFFPCAFRTRAASSAPHAEGEPMWDSRKPTMNLWEFGNLWEIYGKSMELPYIPFIYGKSMGNLALKNPDHLENPYVNC